MTEDQQHDETTMPDDSVEDLAPDEADQEVSGGAIDAFMQYKVEGSQIKGESTTG
jgi:hypothetical protein